MNNNQNLNNNQNQKIEEQKKDNNEKINLNENNGNNENKTEQLSPLTSENINVGGAGDEKEKIEQVVKETTEKQKLTANEELIAKQNKLVFLEYFKKQKEIKEKKKNSGEGNKQELNEKDVIKMNAELLKFIEKMRGIGSVDEEELKELFKIFIESGLYEFTEYCKKNNLNLPTLIKQNTIYQPSKEDKKNHKNSSSSDEYVKKANELHGKIQGTFGIDLTSLKSFLPSLSEDKQTEKSKNKISGEVNIAQLLRDLSEIKGSEQAQLNDWLIKLLLRLPQKKVVHSEDVLSVLEIMGKLGFNRYPLDALELINSIVLQDKIVEEDKNDGKKIIKNNDEEEDKLKDKLNLGEILNMCKHEKGQRERRIWSLIFLAKLAMKNLKKYQPKDTEEFLALLRAIRTDLCPSLGHDLAHLFAGYVVKEGQDLAKIVKVMLEVGYSDNRHADAALKIAQSLQLDKNLSLTQVLTVLKEIKQEDDPRYSLVMMNEFVECFIERLATQTTFKDNKADNKKLQKVVKELIESYGYLKSAAILLGKAKGKQLTKVLEVIDEINIFMTYEYNNILKRDLINKYNPDSKVLLKDLVKIADELCNDGNANELFDGEKHWFMQFMNKARSTNKIEYSAFEEIISNLPKTPRGYWEFLKLVLQSYRVKNIKEAVEIAEVLAKLEKPDIDKNQVYQHMAIDDQWQTDISAVLKKINEVKNEKQKGLILALLIRVEFTLSSIENFEDALGFICIVNSDLFAKRFLIPECYNNFIEKFTVAEKLTQQQLLTTLLSKVTKDNKVLLKKCCTILLKSSQKITLAAAQQLFADNKNDPHKKEVLLTFLWQHFSNSEEIKVTNQEDFVTILNFIPAFTDYEKNNETINGVIINKLLLDNGAKPEWLAQLIDALAENKSEQLLQYRNALLDLIISHFAEVKDAAALAVAMQRVSDIYDSCNKDGQQLILGFITDKTTDFRQFSETEIKTALNTLDNSNKKDRGKNNDKNEEKNENQKISLKEKKRSKVIKKLLLRVTCKDITRCENYDDLKKVLNRINLEEDKVKIDKLINSLHFSYSFTVLTLENVKELYNLNDLHPDYLLRVLNPNKENLKHKERVYRVQDAKNLKKIADFFNEHSAGKIDFGVQFAIDTTEQLSYLSLTEEEVLGRNKKAQLIKRGLIELKLNNNLDLIKVVMVLLPSSSGPLSSDKRNDPLLREILVKYPLTNTDSFLKLSKAFGNYFADYVEFIKIGTDDNPTTEDFNKIFDNSKKVTIKSLGQLQGWMKISKKYKSFPCKELQKKFEIGFTLSIQKIKNVVMANNGFDWGNYLLSAGGAKIQSVADFNDLAEMAEHIDIDALLLQIHNKELTFDPEVLNMLGDKTINKDSYHKLKIIFALIKQYLSANNTGNIAPFIKQIFNTKSKCYLLELILETARSNKLVVNELTGNPKLLLDILKDKDFLSDWSNYIDRMIHANVLQLFAILYSNKNGCPAFLQESTLPEQLTAKQLLALITFTRNKNNVPVVPDPVMQKLFSKLSVANLKFSDIFNQNGELKDINTNKNQKEQDRLYFTFIAPLLQKDFGNTQSNSITINNAEDSLAAQNVFKQYCSYEKIYSDQYRKEALANLLRKIHFSTPEMAYAFFKHVSFGETYKKDYQKEYRKELEKQLISSPEMAYDFSKHVLFKETHKKEYRKELEKQLKENKLVTSELEKYDEYLDNLLLKFSDFILYNIKDAEKQKECLNKLNILQNVTEKGLISYLTCSSDDRKFALVMNNGLFPCYLSKENLKNLTAANKEALIKLFVKNSAEIDMDVPGNKEALQQLVKYAIGNEKVAQDEIINNTGEPCLLKNYPFLLQDKEICQLLNNKHGCPITTEEPSNPYQTDNDYLIVLNPNDTKGKEKKSTGGSIISLNSLSSSSSSSNYSRQKYPLLIPSKSIFDGVPNHKVTKTIKQINDLKVESKSLKQDDKYSGGYICACQEGGKDLQKHRDTLANVMLNLASFMEQSLVTSGFSCFKMPADFYDIMYINAIKQLSQSIPDKERSPEIKKDAAANALSQLLVLLPVLRELKDEWQSENKKIKKNHSAIKWIEKIIKWGELNEAKLIGDTYTYRYVEGKITSLQSKLEQCDNSLLSGQDKQQLQQFNQAIETMLKTKDKTEEKQLLLDLLYQKLPQMIEYFKDSHNGAIEKTGLNLVNVVSLFIPSIPSPLDRKLKELNKIYKELLTLKEDVTEILSQQNTEKKIELKS